mmetsp:Transcript_1292/g.4054  ORF Transcript_1292/g.4054 Transcript_1292/m.4054 type:complete len:206 (-) Transcript_1292:1158-1775(-)
MSLGDSARVQGQARGWGQLRRGAAPAAHLRARRPPHVPRVRLPRGSLGPRPSPRGRGGGGLASSQAWPGRHRGHNPRAELAGRFQPRSPRGASLLRGDARLGARPRARRGVRARLRRPRAPAQHGARARAPNLHPALVLWRKSAGVFHGAVHLLPPPLLPQHGAAPACPPRGRGAAHGGQRARRQGLPAGLLLLPRGPRGGDQAR